MVAVNLTMKACVRERIDRRLPIAGIDSAPSSLNGGSFFFCLPLILILSWYACQSIGSQFRNQALVLAVLSLEIIDFRSSP